MALKPVLFLLFKLEVLVLVTRFDWVVTCLILQNIPMGLFFWEFCSVCLFVIFTLSFRSTSLVVGRKHSSPHHPVKNVMKNENHFETVPQWWYSPRHRQSLAGWQTEAYTFSFIKTHRYFKPAISINFWFEKVYMQRFHHDYLEPFPINRKPKFINDHHIFPSITGSTP